MPSPDAFNDVKDFSNQEKLIPLVVILGPTAVGKSEISILLSERFNGEIVSADSRLFYRGMDIGTAKPTLADRQRIAHHLIDVANPDEIWSLGIFQREAHKAIQDIFQRGHLPFLVGGTGQFVRAVIEGWCIPAVRPNSAMRDVLYRWATLIGPIEYHKKLAILDPIAAEVIDPSNVRRTIRAMEVILSTGKRFSEQKESGHIRYKSLILGLSCPRAELYRRVDDRISRMIESGLIEEVLHLLKLGYSPELPTMSAIGYGEIVEYLQGKISLDDAIVLMKRRTRVFIRRQANWFKENDPQIHWFKLGETTLFDMGGMITQWLLTIT
jgi:tRNA dimethylallyltransferase